MNTGTRLERAVARRLIGRSERIRAVRALILRLAPARLPVLITGESGTGKELAARALHDAGPRGRGPFIAENCAAVPEPLFESLLFGHVKGAFTGAARDHDGLFRRADGGTLLLDEIGDLPLPLQARLLRVLQEREVRPVGSARTIAVDVRILAATNADLGERVRGGSFRADLYYRLRGAVLELPPLRARIDDIPPLTEALLARIGRPPRGRRWRVEPSVWKLLVDYDWPGNVRELVCEVERAAALADGPAIRPGLFSPALTGPRALPEPDARQLPLPLLAGARVLGAAGRAEKRMIERTLAASRGRVAAAASEIGWNRTKLYRRMLELGIPAGFARGAVELRTAAGEDEDGATETNEGDAGALSG